MHDAGDILLISDSCKYSGFEGETLDMHAVHTNGICPVAATKLGRFILQGLGSVHSHYEHIGTVNVITSVPCAF